MALNCIACGMSGGMHTPGCSALKAMQGGIPVIPQPVVINSVWFCPDCGFNPKTDASGPEGILQGAALMVPEDPDEVNQTLTVNARCPICWNKFVREHAPRLVKREVIDGSTT